MPLTSRCKMERGSNCLATWLHLPKAQKDKQESLKRGQKIWESTEKSYSFKK